jgi:hypothetical protein
MIQCFGGSLIKQISGGVECFNPIGRRKASLKQQRPRDIVKSPKDAFDFTVLLRGVRARHAKGDTMSEEECAGAGVVKLAPVVTLDTLDGAVELGGNKGEKVSKSGKRVRLKFKGKHPRKVRAIIKNNEIIFITEKAQNRRCPQIIVY